MRTRTRVPDVGVPWAEPIGWSIPRIVQAADWTLGRLAELGVRIPPENRLQRARRIVETAAVQGDWPAPNAALRRTVSEAARTILEQFVILSTVNVADAVLRNALLQLL